MIKLLTIKDFVNSRSRVLNKKNTRAALMTLSIIGILISMYLLYAKYTHNPLICGFGDCGKVQSSIYSAFLGIPVSVWGAFYYLFLFLCLFKNYRRVAVLCILWGLGFSTYLTFLEVFVIKAICMWCVFSFANIVLIALTYFTHEKIL